MFSACACVSESACVCENAHADITAKIFFMAGTAQVNASLYLTMYNYLAEQKNLRNDMRGRNTG